MSKLKIILIGPQKVGKTLIANIIADMSENVYSQYESTEGVRILETETLVKLNPSQQERNIEVELWDCGGSQKFQSCWPVIQMETNGVIFVYNPQAPEQLPELELLFDYFIIQNGLNNLDCMVLLNQRNNDLDESRRILPRRFEGVSKRIVNAANNPNGIRSEFLNFVENALNNVTIINSK